MVLRTLKAIQFSGALFLMCIPFSLKALTTLEVPVADLATQAQSVMRVVVKEIRSESRENNPEMIISAEVKEVFKGASSPSDSSSSIEIELAGLGKKGSKQVQVLGMPRLRTGAEYIMFFSNNPMATGESAELLGWTLYRVVTMADQSKLVVRVGEPGISKRNGRYEATGFSRVRNVQDYDSFMVEMYRGMH